MEMEELQKIRVEKIQKITKDIENINEEMTKDSNPSIVRQLFEKVNLLRSYL